MKRQPKITIIMPIYNQEELLLRALGSVPLSRDYQVILIDDGSTDDSWRITLNWYDQHRKELHSRSIVHRWADNKGVAAAMNLGFELAEGEYIVSLSSDDYYLVDFDQFKPYLDGLNDLIYFDLEVNDGSIWKVTRETKREYPGAVKFIRREFLGDTRVPALKYREDVPFTGELLAKGPKEVFTGVALKHYNFPREGSLIWQSNHQK